MTNDKPDSTVLSEQRIGESLQLIATGQDPKGVEWDAVFDSHEALRARAEKAEARLKDVEYLIHGRDDIIGKCPLCNGPAECGGVSDGLPLWNTITPAYHDLEAAVREIVNHHVWRQTEKMVASIEKASAALAKLDKRKGE